MRPHCNALSWQLSSYTALLPRLGVSWSEIDPYKARANISDGDNRVSLVLEFNLRGEILTDYTPDRYREVSDSFYTDTLEGFFYRGSRTRRLVLTLAKVEWHLADRHYPYWHASLHEVEYTFV